MVYQTVDQETGQTLLKFWDTKNWKNIGEVEGSYLTIMPDDRTLVYQTTDQNGDALINLWDLKAQNNLSASFAGSYIDMSSDGKTLLSRTSASTGETLINLWETATATARIEPITSNEYSVSADGNVLVFVTIEDEDSFINVLDIATGDTRSRVQWDGNHRSLSANGSILLYSSTDDNSGVVSFNALNTSSGTPIGSPLNGILNRSGTFGPVFVYEIVSDNDESKFSVINTATATLLGDGITGRYSDMTLAQDGQVLIYQTAENKLNLVNVNQGDITELEGTLLTIQQDKGLLLYQTTANNSNTIKLWDIENSKNVGEPIQGKYEAVSPDGETLITRSDANALIFWDLTKTWPFGDPLTEKTDKVSNAVLSPDGETLAFAVPDGITLQDTTTNKTIHTLPNTHIGTVNSVRLNPDKNTLLSLGEDGKILIWDLKNHQQLSDPIQGTDGFFSPKGKFVVVVDGNENTIRLWDTASQQPVAELFDGQGVVFNPDEKFMTIFDGRKNTTTLWNLTTRQVIGEPLNSEQPFTFSPDNKTVALRDRSNNTTTLLELADMSKPISDPIPGTGVTFSPDGQTLAVYDEVSAATTLFDLTARQIVGKPINGFVTIIPEAKDFLIVDRDKNTTTFWDWETKSAAAASAINGADLYFTGTKINVLVVRDNIKDETSLWDPVTHTQIGKTLSGTYSPSFSVDGTLMSMADRANNTTIIWDLAANSQVSEIAGYTNPILCTAAGKKTAAWFDAESNKTIVWDVVNSELLVEIELGKDSEASDGPVITFSPGCDYVALEGNSDPKKTDLWDAQNAKVVGDITGTSVIFSPDGAKIAAVDKDESLVAFWEVSVDKTKTEKLDIVIQGNSTNVNPDNGNIMAAVNYTLSTNSYTSTIWDMNKAAQISDKQNGFYDPIFRTNDTLIIYGKNGVIFWDVKNNSMIAQPLQGHLSRIVNMLFSPNGKILASLASDGIVTTDLDSQESRLLTAADFSSMSGDTMAFSADGKKIIALSRDGKIYIWDLASDPPVLRDLDAPYKNSINLLKRLALSPDGKHVVYEFNGKLNIWDIEKEAFVGDPINPIRIESRASGAITFSPDGKSIYYSDGGDIIRLDDWNVPDQAPNQVGKISTGQTSINSLSLVMETVEPETVNDPAKPAAPRYLFSWLGNNTTQIWDWAKTSKVGDPISGSLPIYGSNAEAQVLIYMDNEGRLIKLDLNPAAWRDLLCGRAGRNFSVDEWKFFLPEDIPYPTRQEEATCPQWPLLPE